MSNLIELTGCNLHKAGSTSPIPSRAPPKIYYYFFLFTKNILVTIDRATNTPKIYYIINRASNKAIIIKFTSEQQSELLFHFADVSELSLAVALIVDTKAVAE